VSGAAAGGWRAGPFVLLGYAALVLLLGSVALWGATARISGAVIASGTLEVAGNRQVVQHPDGGVVTEILARDGDLVAAGDVLLRLEGGRLEAELEIVEGQLFEVVAEEDRLAAQRDAAEAVTFSAELTERAPDSPAVAELMAAQNAQFTARRDAVRKERDQLDERARQVRNQIEGLEAQDAALSEQIAFTREELESSESLLRQGLIQMARVMETRRDLSELSGSKGQVAAQIAENRARLAEIEIEKLKLEGAQQEEAIDALRDLEFREIELRARLRALRDDISRLDVRAPVAGVVYGSTADTLRGVIRAAEPILSIVPQDVDLIVRSRIEAGKVDQVHEGQDAVLRFPAFDARTTPEVPGRVAALSADVFTDERTGAPFYRVDIALTEAAGDALSGRTLTPGMPVEAFISTDERTPLSYFVKPFADYFAGAFRER
jgi:HlyD family secretion protein